jgi:hypothetical protein
MGFDSNLLQEQLCKTLCGQVSIRKTKQGLLQIITPFTFSDGDTFQLYLEEMPGGAVRLTDFGHTMMQLSYENDIAKFREGTRGKLFEQLLASAGMKEESGKLTLETSVEHLGTSLLQFSQGITRIYDLTFLNRARVAGTFYEDLKERVYSLLASDRVKQDFALPNEEEAASYPIDFYIERARTPLFLFGIASIDKARLVTIVLEHWLRAKVEFDSLLVFQNQTDIPRGDLARLSNVGGEMVASLDAAEDFARKVQKLANN